MKSKDIISGRRLDINRVSGLTSFISKQKRYFFGDVSDNFIIEKGVPGWLSLWRAISIVLKQNKLLFFFQLFYYVRTVERVGQNEGLMVNFGSGSNEMEALRRGPFPADRSV